MNNHSEVIARAVHWGFALFVISMLSIGFFMTNSTYNLATYQLHKSLGVIFLGLLAVRIYSRIKHPWRSSVVGSDKESVVKVVHFVLLILMVAMPITGVLSSGFSGYSVHLFDLVIIPENHGPSGNIVPFNATAYEIAKLLHRVIAYALTALVCLHILAALKHHFIDKDTTLSRMWFGRTPKR